MDYATIKSEIANPAYAGLDEPALAAALNAKAIPARVPVPTIAIRRYLHVVRKWARIEAIATGVLAAPDEATAIAAVEMFAALRDFPEGFDLAVPTYYSAIAASLDDCVAAQLIAAGDKTAILALGDGRISRAEQLWGRGTVVTSGDVSRARALDG